MTYLYGLLSLYDFISTWVIITAFGTGDANPIANALFNLPGGWAFVLAVKIFEILGVFALAKLCYRYDRKITNYALAAISGVVLAVCAWNTYAFLTLWRFSLGNY